MTPADVARHLATAEPVDPRAGMAAAEVLGVIRHEPYRPNNQSDEVRLTVVDVATGDGVMFQDPVRSWSGAIWLVEKAGFRPLMGADGSVGVPGYMVADDGRPGPLRMTQAALLAKAARS